MSNIYLVRHGQASFGHQDYDQLSELGSAQSTMLGQYWRKMPKPKTIYSGNLLRHQQTAQAFLAGLDDNAISVIHHSAFNEFDHRDVLAQSNCQEHSSGRKIAELSQNNDALRQFRREFYAAMAQWIEGKHDSLYKESFTEFQARCMRAIYQVINQTIAKAPPSQQTKSYPDIMIFTSGGPISIICGHLLGLTRKQTFEMNKQLKNTGITKLNYGENSLRLDYTNAYGHLECAGEKWITSL